MEGARDQQYLEREEAFAIFDSACDRKDVRTWQEAQEAAKQVAGRQRNRKTINGVFRTAQEILRMDVYGTGVDLDKNTADEIAQRVGYGASARMVRRYAEWLKDWQRIRQCGAAAESTGPRARDVSGQQEERRSVLDHVTFSLLDQHCLDLGALAAKLRPQIGLVPPEQMVWFASELCAPGFWHMGNEKWYLEAETEEMFLILQDHLAGDPLRRDLDFLKIGMKSYAEQCDYLLMKIRKMAECRTYHFCDPVGEFFDPDEDPFITEDFVNTVAEIAFSGQIRDNYRVGPGSGWLRCVRRSGAWLGSEVLDNQIASCTNDDEIEHTVREHHKLCREWATHPETKQIKQYYSELKIAANAAVVRLEPDLVRWSIASGTCERCEALYF